MSTTTAWDAVEYAILAAARQPATPREIAAAAGVTPDTAKTQIEALHYAGVLVQSVESGVRYRLTIAGHKRLFALADTTTDRPGNQTAA